MTALYQKIYESVIEGNADIDTNQCISPLVDYLLHLLAYLEELVAIKCLGLFDQSACDCGWVKPHWFVRKVNVYTVHCSFVQINKTITLLAGEKCVNVRGATISLTQSTLEK